MYTINYIEKRPSFERFDDEHFMLYLNEKAVKFVPEQHMPDEDGSTPKKVSGYSYTGDQPDGGTLIKAKSANYGEFVAGLIALKYSSNAEAAAHANFLLALNDATLPKAQQYKQEFADYNNYRDECKQTAKGVLGIS